jgi:hypothetical protein
LKAPNIINGVKRVFSCRVVSFYQRFIPCATRNVVFLLGYFPTRLIVASFELLLHPEEHPPSNIFSPVITMTAHTMHGGQGKERP